MTEPTTITEVATPESAAIPSAQPVGAIDRRTQLGLVAVFALVAGLSWYGYRLFVAEKITLGQPTETAPAAHPGQSSGPKPVKSLTQEQMERMIKQASDQAEKTPKDATAWAMLAHTYEMQGRFAESVKAYAKLVELAPKDAQVLADYADALAVANGRSFKGEPMALVQRALALDAKNVKALALAGTAYLEAKQADQALKAWESVRANSRDPAMLELADAGTLQAKALSGGVAANVSSAASGPALAPGEGRVTGRVSVAPEVLAKIPPNAVVFIYARPADGGRMPVALLKKKASDLPMDFVLDDTNAMVQGMGLSRLKQVVLVARISASGNVTPAPGDWQAVTAPVAVGQKGIKLEISELLK